MDNTEEHNDKQREIDKLLKSLPKVQASPDFEQRLQRRITDAKSADERTGWRAKFFGSGGIPVFAYSLTTVLLVGIVSYYAFFRSGTIPTPNTGRIMSPLVQDSSRISDLSEIKTVPSTDNRRSDVYIDKNMPRERKAAEGSGKMISAPSQQPLSELKKEQEETRQDINSGQQGYEKDALREAKMDDKGETVLAPQANQIAAPSALLKEEGQSPEVQSKITGGKEQLQLQEFKTAAKSLTRQKQLYLPEARSAQVYTMSAAEVGLDEQLKIITEQIDSLGSRDSLKVDSLRRLQQYLQLQQQKAKVRKPGEKD